MNRIVLKSFLTVLLVLISNYSIGQDTKPSGKSSLRVFSDFKQGIKSNDHSSAFEVKRVYLGYSGSISEHFSAEVKLDIGSPEDLSQYSLIRRYAYFKTAALTFKKDRITAYFGLFDMLQFKTQEQFWGYRYIAKSFQDEYKFGFSADLGAGLRYRINDFLEADIVVSNGEGYNNLQTDDSYNTGIGLTFKSESGIILRSYFDFIKKEIRSNDIICFAGYQTSKYRFGAEYNSKFNSSFLENHNLTGYSFYGTYVINEQWELFGKYDILRSNVLDEETQPWNLSKDGSAIITGVQFKPVTGIFLSINYQDWVAYAQNGMDKAYLFFNLQFEL